MARTRTDDFDDEQESPDPIFAPLLDRHVECATLSVSRFRGRNLEPAFDSDGQHIELLADDEMPDLLNRITEQGRYRVAARDPRTKQYVAYKDYLLRPRRPDRPARPEAPDNSLIEHLRDMVDDLRERLRDTQTRADRDIKFERERADATITTIRENADASTRAAGERADEAVRAAHGQREAAIKKAYEAEVKLAGLTARLEARDQRVVELEDQLTEMKADVENARELAAELKLKADESGFSPLDALMQMDQALDVIGKTAERFGGKT